MSAQLSIFDLYAGVQGKDNGIQQIVDNNPTFVKTMQGVARLIARRRGVVCSDDLREVASQYGIAPKHENAWGGIFRGKNWIKVGTVRSRIPSNHAREIKSWALRDGTA